LSLGYLNPHFFSRRTQLQALYQDKSDGRHGSGVFGVPFYETAARRSLAIQGEAASERVLVFRDGVLDPTVEKMDTTGRTVFLEHHVLRFGAVAGFAAHATTRSYLRVWLAGQWRREDFAPDTTRAVPRSAFGTLGVGLTRGTWASRCSSASTRMPGARTWTSRSCCTWGCGRRRARGGMRRVKRASASSWAPRSRRHGSGALLLCAAPATESSPAEGPTRAASPGP